MKAGRSTSYRFSSAAQWNACLFVEADPDRLRKSEGFRPFAPYTRPGTLRRSSGAHAPAVTRAREILWRDDRCAIHRLAGCGHEPETSAAPASIAAATRIAPTASGLWVKGDPPESLQRWDEGTLTRLLTVDLPDGCVVDIADGGHGSVLALVERDRCCRSVRVDRAGHEVESIEFEGISGATAFVFLKRSRRFVVLAGEHRKRLHWFSAEGGSARFSLALEAMRPCFNGSVLGSDSLDRVFLAGVDGAHFGGHAFVLIFDADGNRLGELPLDREDAPATGITAGRNSLLVTGPRGLLQFDVSELVPENVAQVQCTLMTPMLYSPDREDGRRWLRIEATAVLPDGSTLEIMWGATDKTAVRDRLTAISTNSAIRASQRVAQLLNDPDLRRSRTHFRGAAGSEAQGPGAFSAPLFDVQERFVWVWVTLTAAPGARLPLLTELAVLYPGRTLMADLPAIYRKEERRPESFLRALVGVLETTTQGIDARIGSLGGRVHPSTAEESWLNFIARWLGVPWDDALTLPQKRAIVTRGSDLAKHRGTRAGVEVLLDCLIPGSPRRFRVSDAIADFGFAVLAGETFSGAALPAILRGRTRWSSRLDSSAALGSIRLPCPGQPQDDAWSLAGRIRIDVAAEAAQRTAWEPWLLALILEMVPLAARVELRWLTSQSLYTDRLDGTLTLKPAPPPHLNADTVVGQAHLPEREPRLSEAGPIIGARLR